MKIILIGFVGIIIIAVLTNMVFSGKMGQNAGMPGEKAVKVCWMILIRNARTWIIL